jgi:hypothetical protein
MFVHLPISSGGRRLGNLDHSHAHSRRGQRPRLLRCHAQCLTNRADLRAREIAFHQLRLRGPLQFRLRSPRQHFFGVVGGKNGGPESFGAAAILIPLLNKDPLYLYS